jgi:diketogulonate reductase-like aldo/keto reductase
MSALDTFRHTTIPLAHGTGSLPAVGFGTLIPDREKGRAAIRTALEVGFRHLDAAEAYRNEDVVGDVIKEALDKGVLSREQLFVTTKLWNNNHRPERVKPALEASLRRLQVDYADAYLIHTPFAFAPGDDQYPKEADGKPAYDKGITLLDTWRALEELVDAGLARAIGLSDVKLDTLKEIVANARIKPAIVQVESHPYLPEWELLDFCKANGIVLLAFAPLGHGMEPSIHDDPVLKAIAERIGETPAHVALAWAVQRGTAFLTTSTNPDHIRENYEISPIPDDALREIREGITTNIRLNDVVHTGLPGFIPRENRK